MHSSRMRSARSLTVSRNMGEGACIPRGCMPRGCAYPGEGHAWDTHPLLGTEFSTHACEHITFPQLLLRAVINTHCPCGKWTNLSPVEADHRIAGHEYHGSWRGGFLRDAKQKRYNTKRANIQTTARE